MDAPDKILIPPDMVEAARQALLRSESLVGKKFESSPEEDDELEVELEEEDNEDYFDQCDEDNEYDDDDLPEQKPDSDLFSDMGF